MNISFVIINPPLTRNVHLYVCAITIDFKYCLAVHEDNLPGKLKYASKRGLFALVGIDVSGTSLVQRCFIDVKLLHSPGRIYIVKKSINLALETITTNTQRY